MLTSLLPCRKEKKIMSFFSSLLKKELFFSFYGRLWPFFITHIDVRNIQHWMMRNWPRMTASLEAYAAKRLSHPTGCSALCINCYRIYKKNWCLLFMKIWFHAYFIKKKACQKNNLHNASTGEHIVQVGATLRAWLKLITKFYCSIICKIEIFLEKKRSITILLFYNIR